MIADFIYTLKSLGRAKSFVLLVVATLAFGIGATAAVFSVADWFLFRSHDFPNDVYLVTMKSKAEPMMPVHIVARLNAFEQTDVISEYAACAVMSENVVINGDPVYTDVKPVTANFLNLVGIKPFLGRGFLPDEGIPGRDQVVIISYAFWSKRFGRDPLILQRELTVNERFCKIVGVLKKDQAFPAYFSADVFHPFIPKADPDMPWSPNIFILGKLRAGVSPAAAGIALGAPKLEISPQLLEFYKEMEPNLVKLGDLNEFFRPEVYTIILVAVSFVFAIACLNATNLMLVRILGRRRDLNLRLAIGGGRWLVFRLFVLEGLVLAFLSIIGGALVANWVFPVMMRMAQGSGDMTWQMSYRALGVLCGLGLFSTAATLLVPLHRVFKTDIHAGLKDGGAALGESRRLRRLRGSLIVLQSMFAIVLLSGAGLMLRSLERLNSIDLGFPTERHARLRLFISPKHRAENKDRLLLLKQLQEVFRRVPGIEDASYNTSFLLSGFDFPSDRFVLPDGSEGKASIQYMSRNFSDVTGVKLKRGQWLNPEDKGSEIMVNEAFARSFFSGLDALGQFIKPLNADKKWSGWRIVGVLADTRQSLRAPPGVHIYGPETWYPPAMSEFIFKLTRETNPALETAVRRALYTFDPAVIAMPLMSFDQQRREVIWFEHFALSFLKVLALLALLLAVVGIYSVLSYSVERRMNEFGVRLALGAKPVQLGWMVASRGLKLVALGIGLGLVLSLGLSRFLASLLFETPAYDPLVFSGVAVLLLLSAGVACAWPAWRASQAQIARLLRTE